MNEVHAIIDWVKENHPYAIKFNPDYSVRKSIELYITIDESKGYQTIVVMYGILFVLAMLEYYKFIEDYAKCRTITDSIKECSKLYRFKFPTSMDDPFCQRIKDLSPLEILDVLTGK